MELTIESRIEEVAQGNIGVLTALLNARATLGDKTLNTFLDKVPERGEELWKRFRAVQQEKGEWVTFNHLIAFVTMSNGSL